MRLHTDSNPLPRKQVRLHWLARGLFLGLLAVLLVPAFPFSPQKVYAAAPLEDCDGDGYDETHGETPAGPGTAEWWIEQNKPKDTGGGGGTSDGGSAAEPSGGSSSPADSSSGGSGGSNSRGGARSPSGAASVRGGETAGDNAAVGVRPASAIAPGVSAPAQGVVGSAAASAPLSAATTSSAETSRAATLSVATDQGGPTARNASLWGALTVGFTRNNHELFAGLSLLGALALAGGLALGISALRDMSGYPPLRESEPPNVEEPASGLA